jgi:glycosyltransferase involved in cell wall biosynthesis
MRISYVIPEYYRGPSGGHHVHYTYAGLLQARGHAVTIFVPQYPVADRTLKGHLAGRIWAVRTRLRNRPLFPFFALHPGVRVRLVPDLGPASLPRADVVIATSWRTAELLRDLPADRGRKHYIAYDYETWMTAEPGMRARIGATYTDDFRIVATSETGRAMIRACGAEPAAVIPCGTDSVAFGIDIPPEQREKLSVAFPSRPEGFKGTADAVAAVVALREAYGDRIKVSSFGYERADMPAWIDWLGRPSQTELRQLYNRHAVFVLPSHFEGWGLPAVEAMACGCALVTADNGGGRDYAHHEATALVVPPQAPALLAAAIDRLLRDQPLRLRLAAAGRQQALAFTWEEAATRLERLLRTDG